MACPARLSWGLPPPVQHFFPFGSESLSEVLVFDDADSSWSLRSNYSCPVKSHNAPKDQFTAWGALSYPLKPQFQPLWKYSAHPLLYSNEHRPRQDQHNNENSILVNSGIQRYMVNPYRHRFQRQPPSIFNSLVNKSLLVVGESNSVPNADLEPTHIWEKLALSDDSIQSASWPGGERARQGGRGGI